MATYKCVGFGDERRKPAIDSYRPRERNDKSERDRTLNWRSPPEPQAGENRRGSRGEESSQDTAKAKSQNREALQLNTNIPTAPRSMSSKDSSSSARPSSAKDRVPAGATPTRITAPTINCPKTSDPLLQDTFEIYYKFAEINSKRSLLGWQRDKKKKEMEARRKEASSTPSNFYSLKEAQKLQRAIDEDEMKILTEKYATVDRDHRGALEAIAAISHQCQLATSATTSAPTAPPTTDPAVVALATKFADLEKKHLQAQDEIKKLQTARDQPTDLDKKLTQYQDASKESHTARGMPTDLETKLAQMQEEIRKLQTAREESIEDYEKTTETCRALMSKQNELEKDKSALKKENAKLKEQVAGLEENYVELRNVVSSKVSKMDLLDARASFQHAAAGSNDAQPDVQSLTLAMEALKEKTSKMQNDLLEFQRRVTTAEKDIKDVGEVATRADGNAKPVQDTISRVTNELSSVQGTVSKVEGYVKALQGTVSRVDSDLSGVRGAVSKVGKDLSGVQGAVSRIDNEVITLQERTNNLDFETLDDIEDKWTVHTMGESVPAMKQKLEDMEKDVEHLKGLPDPQQTLERIQIKQQQLRHEVDNLNGHLKEHGSRVVQEPTPPVPDDDLKKQVTGLDSDLRQKTQVITQLQADSSNTGRHIQSIYEKIQKLYSHIDNCMGKQAGLFGELLDDLTARATKLESKASEPNALFYDDIEAKLDAVDQKLAKIPGVEALAMSAKSEVDALNQKTQSIQVCIDSGGQRLEAMAMGLETVNDQINNIWTGKLWDLILKHVDQNYQRYGTRISSLEGRVSVLSNVSANLNEAFKKYNESRRRQDLKRSSSPTSSQVAENSVKRMRT